MDYHNENYERVKLELFQNVKHETLEFVSEMLKDKLLLSVKEIQAILNELHDEREIVLDQGHVYVIDDINFVVGKLRVVRGQFGFVGDSIYIYKEDFGDALDQDEVLVEVVHSRKVSGIIRKVLKRDRTFVVGTIIKDRNKMIFKPVDPKISNPINFKPNNQKLKENQRVIARIERIEKGVLFLKLESILGLADEPGIDIITILLEHNLVTEFNDETLEEAKKIQNSVSEVDIKGRIDHRDQEVITVDSEDAKDLDDAIYLERLNGGYRLYVHIADVSYYVKQDSFLDKSALERTSSIYVVDRVVPMLPKELSNGICSLTPHVDRLTLTCKMDIDHRGVIYNTEIYPSVINSKRRMSYNEINNMEDFENENEMIADMLECAKILQARRTEAGSIDFESDESQFIVDDKGIVLDVFKRTQGESERMIEAFMVSANASVAQYARYQELPVLYRVHEKPSFDKMKDFSHLIRILGYRLKGNLADIHPLQLQKALQYFEDKPEHAVVSKFMLRSMAKARYSFEPLGHFGLSIEDYAHFTAPIRRYSDLWVHRMLRKYIFEANFSEFETDYEITQELGEHVSTKERDILDAEREIEKLKKAQYMEQNIGENYEGVISGISNYGIFVELPNTVEGVVPLKSIRSDYFTLDPITQRLVGEHTKQVYTLGQKVRVQVDSVDYSEVSINLRLKEKSRPKKGVRRRVKYR